MIQSLKLCLDYFQNPERTSVCIMTYDTNIHFYNLPNTHAEPSVMYVGDTQDPFIPMPHEKLMMKVVEDREKVDALLDKLAGLYGTGDGKKGVEKQHFLCTGAAIAAAKALIQEIGMGFIWFIY